MDIRRTLLATAGAVATAAGGHQVLTGVAGVRGRRESSPDPSLDSEIRFYAAWYSTSGLLMLREARRPRDGTTTRIVAGGWVLGAIGRLLSMRTTGRPHPVFVGLTGAELAVSATLALTDPQRTRRQPVER